MEGFDKGTFAIATTDGVVEVEGYTHPELPGLCIHKGVEVWSVTHLGSGRRIFLAESFLEAVAMAYYLIKFGVNWCLPAEELAKSHKTTAIVQLIKHFGRGC